MFKLHIFQPFVKRIQSIFGVNEYFVNIWVEEGEVSKFPKTSKSELPALSWEGECKMHARARTMRFNCKMKQILNYNLTNRRNQSFKRATLWPYSAFPPQQPNRHLLEVQRCPKLAQVVGVKSPHWVCLCPKKWSTEVKLVHWSGSTAKYCKYVFSQLSTVNYM